MQQKNIKGFTILELLVVVAIIAVISGVAIPQFATWAKERDVKNTAIRIKNLAVSISSQVQRGLYGFAQFYVEQLDDGSYLFQTNGMLMSNLATNISDTDDWHFNEVRCNTENNDTFWDHLGSLNNRAEVRSFEVDNVTTSINIPSGICFSKDGSWFGSSGDLANGEEVIMGMYICGNKEGVCPGTNETGEFDMDLLYELSWTRFGNITLERYDNIRKQWIVQ